MKKLFAAVVLTAAVSQVAAGQQSNGPLTRPDPNVVKAYVSAEAIKAAEARQEKIREVAAKLHGMGLRILAFHKDYEASNKAVLAAYAQAPASFRGAGVTFRRFAAEEPFEEIKADYLRLAEICDALAGRYEKRA